MSMKTHPAPFAITSTGTLLVNVAHFDAGDYPQRQLELALQQHGRVFIGVEVSPAEARETLDLMQHALNEGAAHLIGARKRQKKRRA